MSSATLFGAHNLPIRGGGILPEDGEELEVDVAAAVDDRGGIGEEAGGALVDDERMDKHYWSMLCDIVSYNFPVVMFGIGIIFGCKT